MIFTIVSLTLFYWKLVLHNDVLIWLVLRMWLFCLLSTTFPRINATAAATTSTTFPRTNATAAAATATTLIVLPSLS